MIGKCVIGNQQIWFYGEKEKRCIVLSSFDRDGMGWFLLKDEHGYVFESPKHLWVKE